MAKVMPMGGHCSPRSFATALLAFIVVAASDPPRLLASTCDASLIPTSGSLGYRSRDGDRRCEGLYASEVSSDDSLQLASITIGGLRFDPDGPQKLVLTLPDLPAQDAVIVRARSLPLHTYYRMDALLAPGLSLDWPLDEVVLPAGLQSRQIGITGRMPWNGGGLWVPLIVTPPSASPADRRAELIFRSPFDLREVYWRERSSGGPEASWQLIDEDVWAGSPVRLQLPASSGPSRAISLQIAALTGHDGRWRHRELQIWLPGP